MRMPIPLLPWLVLLTPLIAQGGDDLVRKPSQHDVHQTIDRLAAEAERQGYPVFARLDHRHAAEEAGRPLPAAELLLFGPPEATARVMLHDLGAGLDLPPRVLAYQDFAGHTWVVYRNPQALKRDFAVEDCRMLERLEQLLDQITDTATR
jgi:uncharacterized protein (DUF302 family)